MKEESWKRNPEGAIMEDESYIYGQNLTSLYDMYCGDISEFSQIAIDPETARKKSETFITRLSLHKKSGN